MDLDGIYHTCTAINCAHHTRNEDEGADSYLYPTDLTVELLTDSEWLTTAAVYNTFTTEGAPIIFDMSAMLNYSHSRNPRCAPARTHGQIQAPREPPN
jgi:hypothetical protein